MGWAKYDEDNRDYMEERWTQKGGYCSSVFNYTSEYSGGYRNTSRSSRSGYSDEALRAYYHNFFGKTGGEIGYAENAVLWPFQQLLCILQVPQLQHDSKANEEEGMFEQAMLPFGEE